MGATGPMDVKAELAALDEKLNALLPARYQHCYSTVSPMSMGSAKLKYGADGKVVWDEIWTTFCDLALAGGPPHRGKLLAPVSRAEAEADPARTAEVVAEIDRAIGLTTGSMTVPGYEPGWLGVHCQSVQEASWLRFAVTAENVSARRRKNILQVPAGPGFRVEKEIKNVVVAISKSLHYWDGHLTDAQQSLGGEDDGEPASPDEIAAAPEAYAAALAQVQAGLRAAGVEPSPPQTPGWIGLETGDDEEAVWLLRAILVDRVPVRREEHVLYLPIPADPSSRLIARVLESFTLASTLWKAKSARPATTWRLSGPL